jgi:hypothetical protein
MNMQFNTSGQQICQMNMQFNTSIRQIRPTDLRWNNWTPGAGLASGKNYPCEGGVRPAFARQVNPYCWLIKNAG